MMRLWRHAGCFAIVPAVLVMAGCAHIPLSSQDVNNRVKLAEMIAEDAAGTVELAGSISLRALENGLAARDEAEKNLALAQESGDPEKIASARESLKAVSEDLGRSRRIAEKVFSCCGRVRNLAGEVKDLAEWVTSRMFDSYARIASRRAERLAGEAARAADEAEKSMEILKRRWLSLGQYPLMI